MSVVRFNPPLVNNNPRAPREKKRQAKPEEPVGSRELVAPRLQDFPSMNSPLYNQGLEKIRKALGTNAFVVMSELGNNLPGFQLTQARVAERTQLSRYACDKAIQSLVNAGYIERVECRKAGRRFGNVLHSCLAGNIQKLNGYVTHYSVEANTKEAAMREVRRKEIRASHNPSNPDRPGKGGKRKRRAVGDETVQVADTFQEPETLGPPEIGTPGADPSYPYNGNVTEEEEKEILLPPFPGEKEVPNLVSPEGSAVGTSSVEPGASGAPDASGAEEGAWDEEFDKLIFDICPVVHPELRSSLNNAMVRALVAPEYGEGAHVGYDLFAPMAPAAFETPIADECLHGLPLGLEEIPRTELNGDGAKLWLMSHKIGIVIMQCFKDFDDVTNLEALQIVKKLRSGKMNRAFVFKTWAEVVSGARKPFTAAQDFLQAWYDRVLPDPCADYDLRNLIEYLEHNSGSLLLEEAKAECDAEETWAELLEEGREVYEFVKEMSPYNLSMRGRIECYVENQKCDKMPKSRRTVLRATMAMWVHAKTQGDEVMLADLRCDCSLAWTRQCMLVTSTGRRVVRGIQKLHKAGEVNFCLATEAGWHSFSEYDVLAKFHVVAADEALRLLNRNF
ncbi:MarR family transcriptional regulator [Prosthecobacter vanneervenii]|uniref:DNA-binding Lrp family transcriptional regulator n=1 Tax=Prosthecobacter vanneervenii TaxID=48466 RepID=A0A7W8DL30_9BACT|nr:helix-turn-helix domain-containing protein [Prosthecobacter vanneervenii]MBB5033752.1 DNA-binding Lrp family transcriptional regulator [Prosthecobacter vanneervenii]